MTPEPPSRFDLPRSAPEAQGVSSAAVLAFVEAAEVQTPELHGLMLLRHGHVCAEGWWTPYASQRPHMLFSLSKSFASTAAGLAAAEGRFSLDDAVLSFFPEQAPAEVGPNLAAMRVRHLLSMATGHDQDTTGRLRSGVSEDWVGNFLALPVEHEPGTHFVYNSGATYMVSAIVQKATGQPILEYLRPRLFEPLGIDGPTWENSPQGVNTGGWGLSIRTEDIARFGLLYLQRGGWQGTRLLPEAWVAEATAKQVSNGTDPDSDWAQGYGYQFWRCRHGAYRGDGAFGQFCVVLPEQDAVVAITGGVGDLQGVLRLIWEHLLPAMGPAPLPNDPAAQGQLAQKLAGLSLSAPDGERSSPVMAEVSGKTYTFAPENNEAAIEAVTWDFREDKAALTIRNRQGEHRIEAGTEEWREGVTAFGYGTSRPVAARGAWTAADTYTLKACYPETPFSLTVTAQFLDDRLRLDLGENVSFGPTERPPLEGRVRAD